MNRKIYLIQPTYRGNDGRLLQGKSMFVHSCAIPALSAAIPVDWERRVCLEFFEDVDYQTDASVVGISSMGYDILHGYEIADEFRRRGKVVIFGGYQAHFNRARLRQTAHAIVYGHPGPKQMASILADAESGSLAPEYEAGINIDFPFDYSMLIGRRISYMPILTSVGCRNQCDFCCTGARYRGRYRLRKLANVLADVRGLRRHTRRFGIVDSNVYNNRGYLLALCAGLRREQPGITWGAEATIDIGEDEESLRALRSAGCRILFLGLETPNQRSLDSINKPCVARTYEQAIRNIRRQGIIVAGYFMVGLDGDTAQTFDELFDFIQRTRVNVPVINVLLPAPGTRVFERLNQQGRLLVRGEDDFLKNALAYAISCSNCFYTPALLSVEQVEEGLVRLRSRLSSLRATLRRSVVLNPRVAAWLLLLNAEFRRETKRIVAARAQVQGNRSGNGRQGVARLPDRPEGGACASPAFRVAKEEEII